MDAAIGLAGELFGAAAAAAFLLALALGWLGRHFAPRGVGRYTVLPWTVALSFVAGYALLPREFAGFVPEAMQPWKWLPYVGLGAALFSSVLASASPKAGRFAIAAAVPIAAWCFTPGWPVWGFETRSLMWIVLAYLLLVGLPLQALPKNRLGAGFLGLLIAAAFLLAVTVAGLVSLRLAQLAVIAASSLLGALIAGVASNVARETAGASVLAVYTVLVGGIAWIACVEPDPPEPGLLAIPLLPAVLWLIVAVQAAYSKTAAPRESVTP